MSSDSEPAGFYAETPDKALRFGDIVTGFPAAIPRLPQPILDASGGRYDIEVGPPSPCVILSPCCSIGHEVFSLCAMKDVQQSFFSNPYFDQDLTNVNRKMTPQQSVPPRVWESLPELEKQRRLQRANPANYACNEFFVYACNPLLPEYTVHRRKGADVITGCYMIDFRDMFTVRCSAVKSAKQAPIGAKILQLSIETRRELRAKLVEYFNREAAEDVD